MDNQELPEEVKAAIECDLPKLADAAGEEMIDVADERFSAGTANIVNRHPQYAWAIHEDGFKRGMLEGARIALATRPVPQTQEPETAALKARIKKLEEALQPFAPADDEMMEHFRKKFREDINGKVSVELHTLHIVNAGDALSA